MKCIFYTTYENIIQYHTKVPQCAFDKMSYALGPTAFASPVKPLGA